MSTLFAVGGDIVKEIHFLETRNLNSGQSNRRSGLWKVFCLKSQILEPRRIHLLTIEISLAHIIL